MDGALAEVTDSTLARALLFSELPLIPDQKPLGLKAQSVCSVVGQPEQLSLNHVAGPLPATGALAGDVVHPFGWGVSLLGYG